MKCKPSVVLCGTAPGPLVGVGPLLLTSSPVGHGLATLVDSMRESIYALRCDSFCLQSAQSKQNRSSKPVLITYIGFFACFHSIFFTCSGFRKGLHSSEAVIGRLVACSERIADDNQTDTPSTVTLAEHMHRELICTCI